MAIEGSKLILVLGGARAGKSRFALRLANEHSRGGAVCFIATAQALDPEMSRRIARHREERPQHWNTLEENYELDQALLQSTEPVIIVDCLTLLVSNWLLRVDDETQCEEMLQNICESFLTTIRSQGRTVICVSNEVGLGVVPETRLGRSYRDLLGGVNQQLAAAADEVWLLVAGLPLRIKPHD